MHEPSTDESVRGWCLVAQALQGCGPNITPDAVKSKSGAKGAKWAENVAVKAASEATMRIKVGLPKSAPRCLLE